MINKQRSFRILIVLSTFCLIGCSGKWIPGLDFPRSLSAPDEAASTSSKPTTSTVVQTYKFPWEVWPLRFDMRGAIIDNELILTGDQELEQGNRSAALNTYKRAMGASLTPLELEAVTLRISSLELSLGQAESALKTLSDYFVSIGKLENQVIDPRFSLIFAYSYGSTADINQSLAWFSRAERQSGGKGVYHDVAAEGVKTLLEAITNDQFYPLAVSWANDSFIHKAIGLEKSTKISNWICEPGRK